MEKGKYKIKVLDKAFKILELFDEKGKDLTVTEIHNLLGFNKASVFRIIKNLEDADYLEKDPDTLRYKLGLRLYSLGLLAEPHSTIRRITRPFLTKLNEQCGETVHLAVLNHGEALYLDKLEGKKTIRVITRIGTKLPAHCSGLGKILLASLSEETLEKIIGERGLRRFTDNSITHLGALKTELAKIRKQRCAIDNEEIEEGLKCAAAPVRDSEGKVVAAISVSVPKERFDKDISTLISMVKKTAEQISESMRQQ
ncbi:MAG: IclR family transcriptional regulator [Deltaproteobacteria bacterium]|nr:IclR family transcriptional regulator [Deltaproteobacteria bacterium]